MGQILVYHKILLHSNEENCVDLFHFFFQMLYLKITKKNVICLDNYYSSHRNTVVLTFDDGYSCIKKYALPILKLFNFPFELFICDDFVKSAESGNKDFLSINDLKYLKENGAKLQYHTKSHKKLIETNTIKELEEEIICPNI